MRFAPLQFWRGVGERFVYTQKTLSNAKELRRNQTPWEDKLWYHLRAKRFFGIKFKRQVPVENYIVDFCCREKMLIIELDGGGHKEVDQARYDSRRDSVLKEKGYIVLRFNNNDVMENIEGVLEEIRRAVTV